jgi:hypothetical protein
MASIGYRLEQYTIRHPQEVLLVTADIDGEVDEVTIFKGFSSSLVRPTASDPDVPVLPDGARIVSIDRIRSPYDARSPQYIERGISLDDMLAYLRDAGV